MQHAAQQRLAYRRCGQSPNRHGSTINRRSVIVVARWPEPPPRRSSGPTLRAGSSSLPEGWRRRPWFSWPEPSPWSSSRSTPSSGSGLVHKALRCSGRGAQRYDIVGIRRFPAWAALPRDRDRDRAEPGEPQPSERDDLVPRWVAEPLLEEDDADRDRDDRV